MLPSRRVSDDLVLFDRWCNGDKTAGQTLLQRHFDAIYNFFGTKCEAEADELTQATFLACLKSRDQFRKQSSFRTYLFTIARHELYHLLRRRERHDKKLDFAISSIAEIITTPGSRIQRQQEQARLVDALRTLPVDVQTLLELHYWEDQGIPELAEIFEVDATVIRTRLSRARKQLKEQLETLGVGTPADDLASMDDWVRAKRAKLVNKLE